MCPLTDEWIKMMWHIYTMEYYSAIKRTEIELFVVRWMDPESVIQSEVSQKDKKSNSKRYIHPNVHCSTIYNSQDPEATSVSIDR